MNRDYYQQLARQDLRMPIAADLILHEQEDPLACRYCGDCLGKVIIETANRFHVPLAFPLMDLRTEKEWMLMHLGIAEAAIDGYHFSNELTDELLASFKNMDTVKPTRRMTASLDALRYVASHSDKIPVGMCIGPFSLMTKLLEDPISACYHAGMEPDDEESLMLLELMDRTTRVVIRWIELQSEAGAKAICLCEPAYNCVYLSPKQIAADDSLIDLLVLQFLRRVKCRMDALGVDLILHDCGELNEAIIRSFNQLEPSVLSLGSPCDLPTVARFVNPEIVIMGNIASKKFYSDAEITAVAVAQKSRQLVAAMKQTGHPFILGTECDVLCVQGCEHTIMAKVLALVNHT